MERMTKTDRPVWVKEGKEIETAAMRRAGGAEYRFPDGADFADGQEGMRAAVADETEGAEPSDLKNKQDFKG